VVPIHPDGASTELFLSPHARSRSRTRRPSSVRGHPSRVVESLCVCPPRRRAPTRVLASRSRAYASEHARAPAYTARTRTNLVCQAPAEPRPETSRCPAVVPAMGSTPPRRPSLPCSFPSSPGSTIGTRKPHHGTCGPCAAKSHRRRGHPAPPLLWGIPSNAWRYTLKPRGVLPDARWAICKCGRSRSSGSGTARQSHLNPHVCLHSAADPVGIPCGRPCQQPRGL
jgi:hypothetical protein